MKEQTSAVPGDGTAPQRVNEFSSQLVTATTTLPYQPLLNYVFRPQAPRSILLRSCATRVFA